MNIAQALKEKNRIVGRISNLTRNIEKYNQYESTKTVELDSRKLLTKLQEETAQLIRLKTRIATANVNIAEKLIRLSEAKTHLRFWVTFVSYSGQALEQSSRMVYKDGARVEEPYFTVSAITTAEALANIEIAQKEIEDLQDCIDNYNATTEV